MSWLFRRAESQDASTDRLIRMFQSEAAELRETRPPVQKQLTVLTLAAMIGAALFISNYYVLDRVVTSTFAQVVTVDPSYIIQPLDQSIIKTIDVKEGDRVKKGQLLATLDSTFASADVDALKAKIASLDPEIARCRAELDGKPFDMESGAGVAGVDYVKLQRSLYQQRKAQFEAQVRAYDEQIAQARATVDRLKGDTRLTADRNDLAAQVEKMWVGLQSKDSGSLLQVLTAKDATLQLVKEAADERNTIVETEHQIESTVSSRQAFIEQWRAQTSQELVTAQNARDDAQQQLEKARKHQDLVRIESPDDAFVLRMVKRSVGSIMQPGETFVELALLSSPLEVEAYIQPIDVGFVRPGDRVILKFDPYHYVEHGWGEGQLRWVSQGTFTAQPDSTGGAVSMGGTSVTGAGPNGASGAAQGSTAPYYKARISITNVKLTNVPADYQLLPGTTLEADVQVGTRSVFWYMMEGLVRGFQESMREP